MQRSFKKAQQLILPLRFGEDRSSSLSSGNTCLNFVKNSLYKNGLEITTKTTKELGNAFQEVKEFLGIPTESVKTFVYASPEIQAECFLGPDEECVMRFSSSIIELLDIEEIKFVFGHELGHFLLEHGGNNTDSDYWVGQAREISADRIGLICAKSLDVAFKAILKTVSGLDDKHINFDISEYISQMKKYLEVANIENNNGTHPSMILRSRALIWFSLSDSYKKFPEIGSRKAMFDLDKRILLDFNKEKECIENMNFKVMRKQIEFWVCARYIFSKGIFSKKDQKLLEEIIGEESCRKMTSLFTNFTRNEIDEEISKMFAFFRSDEFKIELTLVESTIKDSIDSLKKKIA